MQGIANIKQLATALERTPADIEMANIIRSTLTDNLELFVGTLRTCPSAIAGWPESSDNPVARSRSP